MPGSALAANNHPVNCVQLDLHGSQEGFTGQKPHLCRHHPEVAHPVVDVLAFDGGPNPDVRGYRREPKSATGSAPRIAPLSQVVWSGPDMRASWPSTVIAAGADLGATGYGVPRGIGPFDPGPGVHVASGARWQVLHAVKPICTEALT